MLIQNTSSTGIQVLEYYIEGNSTVDVPNEYVYHPVVSSLISSNKIKIVNGTSVLIVYEVDGFGSDTSTSKS